MTFENDASGVTAFVQGIKDWKNGVSESARLSVCV